MDLYYDPATWNMTRYNGVSGRGNNTGFHSGMFVPGLIGSTNFAGAWRNNANFSLISSSGLTADWYRFSMIVTSTTVVIKLLNLRTNVELTGNTVSVGTVDNSDTYNYTFLCYGITGSTGAYGSIGVNFSNITISRNGTCLLHVPLSSGTNDKVVDICNKVNYSLGFFTTSIGWAKLSDYFHANFYYGYTLYTKSGSSNLYVCNAHDGTEITLTTIPSGYTRVGNYSNCKDTFNQCESKFKLDDVNVSSITLSGALTPSGYNGTYVQNGEWAGNPKYDKIDDPTKNIWKSASPYDVYGWAIGDITSQGYWYEYLNGDGNDDTPFPWNVTSFSPFPLVGATGTVTVTLNESSSLYLADYNHVLFTDGTGVAKEFNISDIKVDINKDRGYLYIGQTLDNNFLMYKTDKTLSRDVKILKFLGYSSKIIYSDGQVVYDENNHATLTE